MITVVIADDHPLVRDGIVAILTREPDLEVLAQAGSGPEAVAMVAHHDPDVVLMDLRMPGGDGVDAIRTLRGQRSDRPRILVLTTYDTDRDIRAGRWVVDDTIAPYAAIGSLLFAPAAAERALRHYYTLEPLKGRYGFQAAYNLAQDWFAPDVIGIDKGISLLMLANAQDGFVLDLMRPHPALTAGLERLQITRPD